MLPFSHYYQAVIVPASILMPVIIALAKYRIIGRSLKLLLLYLLVSGGINLLAILNSHSNNLPLLHIYTVAEFILLILYFKSITSSPRALLVYRFLLFFFPLLCLINVIFFQSKFQYNSYVRPLEALVLIGCCFYYFYNSAATDTVVPWGRSPTNWINSGILLYFSTSLFLFIFSNVIHQVLSREAKTILLNLHDTLVLVMYLLFAIGIRQCRKSPTISIS